MQQTPVITAFGDLTLIGRGAFAHVYRGYDEAFNRDVAIKVIDSTALGDDGVRRFERECRAIGAVSAHPKIVTVYSSGTLPTGAPYIVMDLMDGSLTDVLHREGSLPWADAVAIGCDIASAAQAAHDEGILHRDIKPDNILISRYGHAQLADFGISSIFGTALGAREAVTASVAHAAPEVLEGRRATPASDVYSVASTVVTMILGRPPFTRPEDERVLTVIARIKHDAPPRLTELGVPSGLQAVLDKAMAKNPADRYAAAVDFADALGEFRPRIADTRNLLTPRRGPTRPPVEEPPDATPTQRPASSGGLIPPDSLIPGGRLSRINGLIPPAAPERDSDPEVPAQADPVGGSNRVPVNPTLAALIPPAADVMATDEAAVEVLRPEATPADLRPVDVEVNEPEQRPAVRVLSAPIRPILDPRDPLLAGADDAATATATAPRRRYLAWLAAGVVALGAATGGYLALAGHHHAASAAGNAALPPATLTALPSPSFSSTCSGWDCTFTVSATGLPDGATLIWTFPGGSTATGATVHHTFGTAGDHKVQLAVSDGARTGAPSTSTIALSAWTPRLSISTGGPPAAPTIHLAASSDQRKCLTGSAQLQRQSGDGWQPVRTVSLGGSHEATTDAPSSGTYRWLLPASSLPNGECQQASSDPAHVRIARSTSDNSSSTSSTSSTSGTSTDPSSDSSTPPRSGSGGGSSPNPRNNAPVPPGG